MAKPEDILTALNYDPKTGMFFNAVTRGNRSKIGEVVGCPQTGGYLRVVVKSKSLLLHRIAFLFMENRMPDGQVDHINGNTSDNRWVNLREATGSENQWNSKKPKNNTSGLKGVTEKKGRNLKLPFRATIMAHRKYIHLGYFASAKEAHEAYVQAADLNHKSFANY